MKNGYTLTAHAAIVVAERGIHKEWIQRVLSAPIKVIQDIADPTRCHAYGSISERDDRTLHIIYNNTTYLKKIISVYFDLRMRGKR